MVGRPVRPGPVASEMTPTTGAADVVTLARSSHVLQSSRSSFRCVLYALGRLRRLSVAGKASKLQRMERSRRDLPFRDDTDNRGGGCIYQWFLDCTSMIAAIFSSVQEIAHVTKIIQETCTFTPTPE